MANCWLKFSPQLHHYLVTLKNLKPLLLGERSTFKLHHCSKRSYMIKTTVYLPTFHLFLKGHGPCHSLY